MFIAILILISVKDSFPGVDNGKSSLYMHIQFDANFSLNYIFKQSVEIKKYIAEQILRSEQTHVTGTQIQNRTLPRSQKPSFVPLYLLGF